MAKKEAKWKASYRDWLNALPNGELLQEAYDNACCWDRADDKISFEIKTSETVLRERLTASGFLTAAAPSGTAAATDAPAG